jgi:hypothetical protein
VIAAVALAALLAQPLPGEASPPGDGTRLRRIHLVVSESLPLAMWGRLPRARVTLWLETRSNAQPTELVERLAGFEEVYVRMRPPLRREHLDALARAPRVGLWLMGEELGDPSIARRGTRPLAVSVRGELTEEGAAQIARGRPAHVRWTPRAFAELKTAEWARFLSLPGALSVVVGEPPASACEGSAARRPVTVEGGATALARWARGCGAGARLVLTGAEVERARGGRWDWEGEELWLEVRSDSGAARAARRLIDGLEGKHSVEDWEPGSTAP